MGWHTAAAGGGLRRAPARDELRADHCEEVGQFFEEGEALQFFVAAVEVATRSRERSERKVC